MGLHGSDNRHMVSPSGAVATAGQKSYQLAIDQIGLFPVTSTSAVTDLNNVHKRTEFVFRQGKVKIEGRTAGSKASSTIPFQLSNVEKVSIGYPRITEQKFDYFRVGWNGDPLDVETGFKFRPGDNWNLEITIGGDPVTYVNSTGCFTAQLMVSVPPLAFSDCTDPGNICDVIDCKDQTIQLVDQILNFPLPTGEKLSKFLEVVPIMDEVDVVATVDYDYHCLEYCGFGDANELAFVQAQYPTYTVYRDTMTGKFVLIAPAADVIANYTSTLPSIIKGCEDCPAGYTENAEAFVYVVQLEDDGATQVVDVQAISVNTVALSAVRVSQDFGVGYYTVQTTVELTPAELAAFTALEPTSVVILAGTTAAVCSNATITSTAWTDCGTCVASEDTYRIMVADDCNGDRLAELEARYPDLTITLISTTNCVSIYETVVATNLNCDEGCSQAIVQLHFQSEAPAPFTIGSSWYKVSAAAVANVDRKCGIEIKAKPFIINASECLINELPFMATSVRIKSVSGGNTLDHSLNSFRSLNNPVAVLRLDRAQDLDNLGGDLRAFEQMGKFYFENQSARTSPLSRALTGTQTRLDGLAQYVDAAITVADVRKTGMNSLTQNSITYHFLVPVGRSAAIELLLKEIAGKADAELVYV